MDPGPSNPAGRAGPQKSKKAAGKGKQEAKSLTGHHSQEALDKQSNSIGRSTATPKTLALANPTSLKDAKAPKKFDQIRDKKLRAQMAKQHLSQKRAVESAKLANEYLHASAPGEGAGMIETEGDLERTHRVTQREIKESVGIETARKAFELRLDGGKNGTGLGPYRCDYTRNGRHLLLGGRKGHLAAFDWQSGKMSCEIQVKETVRDVKWLHNSNFFAAAQKKYTFIYDSQGIEIHKMKHHNEVNRMEFLPYHFLLATVGNGGWLKYQDTSVGNLVVQHRTGLGACNTMAQNPLTAVIHLGHSNGTVTLWTPNLSTPAVKLLAHRGPVTGISIDTRNGGREMVTSGLDGSIKVWDSRMLGRGPRREWISRKPATDVQYSQRGLLGVGWGAHVSVYDTNAPLGNAPPGPYITNGFPRSEPLQVRWCPFEDVLGVGHLGGFTSLIVPGAGEPNFDSSEADPFETKNKRREREVHALLDKIQPQMITVDPDVIGSLTSSHDHLSESVTQGAAARLAGARGQIAKAADGTPYARLSRVERLALDNKGGYEGLVPPSSHVAEDDGDEDMAEGADEELDVMKGTGAVKPGADQPRKKKEAKKARGRNSTMKKYLRKQQKNVIDPTKLAIKAKLERRKAEREAEKARQAAGGDGGDDGQPRSALDVFTRKRQ
ncbi:related to UTP7 - nucleolar protein, component of the small subunit processome [Pseudozyma flocculosa]|uniref:U three protein 7 n=1 Tax=Pseudozyma flocculosa TaxID=84751 RepID=A0A5C3ER92_9BASI|nr:related to UTP7 - nucleolar protein, component of the small subunit processome [Pseudozyma flocculosa]